MDKIVGLLQLLIPIANMQRRPVSWRCYFVFVVRASGEAYVRQFSFPMWEFPSGGGVAEGRGGPQFYNSTYRTFQLKVAP